MTEEHIVVVCDNISEPEKHLFQLISKASELASQNKSKVCVICPPDWKYEDYQTLAEYGADEVIAPESGKMQIRPYCDYIEKIIVGKKVFAVLYPATSFGKSVAARISVRVGASLTADCVEIGYDEQGKIWVQRAAMNDSVLARIKCINCDISMCTVKAYVFQINRSAGRSGKVIIKGKLEKNELPYSVIESLKREHENDVDLDQFKKFFCVGRGVRKAETYERIKHLAEKCGACVIGTRAAVEDNIIEKTYQVGQSGKNVQPELYVAFGVSGASQHMVGIKGECTIIAINNDENARIFDYSDYKIVADLNDIIEQMEKFI